MRVLFFGTSPFAVPVLQALHDSVRHTVLGVVTQPDRPKGRGQKVQMSPIKELALTFDYPIHQPERVRRKPFPALVAEIAPDALVVVSFGQIIPQAMLELPRFGGINIHASLLPRWRGAAPIHHAIIAGDSETGVATMQMEPTLDTGPVFLVAREPILPTDTVGTLEPRLAALGAPLLIETLDQLEAGTLRSTVQPEDGMTLAPPVTRETGFLDPVTESANALDCRVRGTNPRPGAFLMLAGKAVRVWEVQPLSESAEPGIIARIEKNGIVIGTLSGSLLLTRVQPENRAPMAAADFARGARLNPGEKVGKPNA